MTSAIRAATADDQCALAQRYISAYFLKDNPLLHSCISTDSATMFMAYPFAAAPVLSAPKVHKNQAVIEFTAPMRDAKIQPHGGIVFYKSPVGWRVREVLFYNKIPAIFGLPPHSITRDDRAQEAKVVPIGQAFMAAWRANDTRTMSANWFNWTAKIETRVKALTLSQFHGVISLTAWGDPYVTFSVKATYHFGPFSYSQVVHGGVILAQTREGLKVRANHLILQF